MRRLVYLIFFLAFYGSVTGCSTTGRTTYLKARNGALLQVNPPLTKQYITRNYLLPSPPKQHKVNDLPPSLQS